MAKKLFSVILVPHHRGKSKTISLTEKKVKLLVGIGSFAIFLLFIFLIDYITMNVVRQKYRALQDEYNLQKQNITTYKLSINKLEQRIQDFENYAKKINVMAGLKSPEVLREVGVGGGGRGDYQSSVPIPPQDTGLMKARDASRKAAGVDRNLNTLVRFFEDKTIQLATTPSIWPTNGWTTSGFGPRTDPFTGKDGFHYGLDIATNPGNPVYATADGQVISVKFEKIGGNTVILNHGGGVTTVYCHLSKFNVKVGQKIKRWDVIGYVGQTGKALGPHVHYEVRKNGKAVNPWNYIIEE